MGAKQSKPDFDEKVIYGDTPIQFSQDVVNHLADSSASPETSPERQSTLDAHIRSRIQAELSRLRSEEEEVKREIERVLERENIERERKTDAQDAESPGGAASSDARDSTETLSGPTLLGDLEEVRQKVEAYRTRQGITDHSSMKDTVGLLQNCFRDNNSTPLECWREVSEFKKAVAHVEQNYVERFR